MNQISDSPQRWYEIEARVMENEKEWLTRSFILRTHNNNNLKLVRECFITEGLGSIWVRHLGDNEMLLKWDKEANVSKTIKENCEWLGIIFKFITPWAKYWNKLSWVKCRGILLSLWGYDCLEKVVAIMGTPFYGQSNGRMGSITPCKFAYQNVNQSQYQDS